jgi:hypothetical protein
VADAGAPISYEVLETGTQVYSSDGAEVGRVTSVRADLDADIFDGLEIDTAAGRRYVTADHVTALHERRVDLDLAADGVAALPAPDTAAPSFQADPGAGGGLLSRLAARLGGRGGWKRSG